MSRALVAFNAAPATPPVVASAAPELDVEFVQRNASTSEEAAHREFLAFIKSVVLYVTNAARIIVITERCLLK